MNIEDPGRWKNKLASPPLDDSEVFLASSRARFGLILSSPILQARSVYETFNRELKELILVSVDENQSNGGMKVTLRRKPRFD